MNNESSAIRLPNSQEEAEAQLIDWDRVYLPTNFHEFVKAAWPIIEPGAPLVDSWHIKVICDHLQALSEGTIRRLIINVPPRTGKSNLVSILWPCWEWTRDPSLRWVYCTYNLQKLSIPQSGSRRSLILSEWYQARWGDLVQLTKDEREKSNFSNTARGKMFCTAINATMTGIGGLRLVLDDPQDPDGAESELVREGTQKWLSSTWPTRADSLKDARYCLIQQRLHEVDATGIYLKTGKWDHLKIQMEYTGERSVTALGEVPDPRTQKDEILDPERFPREHLETLKKDMNPYAVAGQLQQNPAPLDGGLVKRAWINHYEEPEENKLSVMNALYQFDVYANMRFITVDPALTEDDIGGPKKGTKADPDYSVIAIWSLFVSTRGPVLCLLDVVHERMEGPDLRPKVKAVYEEWNAHFVVMENIIGKTVYQYLKRDGVPIRDASTKEDAFVHYEHGRANKTARLMTSTSLMADQRFWVPTYAPWLGEYIQELCTFPNAGHDDYVDATTIAIAVAEKFRHLGDSGYTSKEEDRREITDDANRLMRDRDKPVDIYTAMGVPPP